VVHMGFAKAFNSVVHSELLTKLRSYGVCDMMLAWIKAVLVNRCQTVLFGACLSPLCSVLSGFSQGSVLGPILFILFCSCLADNVYVNVLVDDAKMYTVITDGISSACLCQRCLDQVVSWAEH
jgi:ribonuclease P/MRP protein subunit RPP40